MTDDVDGSYTDGGEIHPDRVDFAADPDTGIYRGSNRRPNDAPPSYNLRDYADSDVGVHRDGGLGIRIPCGRQIPCAAIGGTNSVVTVTMACQEDEGHDDGPHVVTFVVTGQWRVRIEAEDLR